MKIRSLCSVVVLAAMTVLGAGCLPTPAEPKANQPSPNSAPSADSPSSTKSDTSSAADTKLNSGEASSEEKSQTQPSPSTTTPSSDSASLPATQSPSTSGSPETSPETPAASTENRSLNGKYRAISAQTAGTPLPDDFLANMSLELSDDQYVVTIGISVDKGESIVNWDTMPGQITIKGKEGPNKDKTILAIFEKSPDGKLKIAYDLTGTAFPTSFDSTAENKNFYAVYEPVPPEKSASEEK